MKCCCLSLAQFLAKQYTKTQELGELIIDTHSSFCICLSKFKINAKYSGCWFLRKEPAGLADHQTVSLFRLVSKRMYVDYKGLISAIRQENVNGQTFIKVHYFCHHLLNQLIGTLKPFWRPNHKCVQAINSLSVGSRWVYLCFFVPARHVQHHKKLKTGIHLLKHFRFLTFH